MIKIFIILVGVTLPGFFSQPNESVKASEIEGTTDCPAEGNTGAPVDCFETPDEYKVTFFELGFCTSDPLSTDTFNKNNCHKAWENNSGQTIDIANCLNVDCSLSTGSNYRIDDGTYSHAYAVLDSVISVKGKVFFNNKTYYTTSTARVHQWNGLLGGSVPSDNIANFSAISQRNDFLAGEEGGNDCWDFEQTLKSGEVKAILTNSNLITATNQAECSNSTRMVGSVQMSSPLTMSKNVSGYKMTWHVTKLGLFADEWDQAIDNLYSLSHGPFATSFEFLK